MLIYIVYAGLFSFSITLGVLLASGVFLLFQEFYGCVIEPLLQRLLK